jgi:uncharacterized membrane protein
VLKLGEQLEMGRIELWATSDVTAKYNTKKVINQFYNIAITEKDKYHDNPSGQE